MHLFMKQEAEFNKIINRVNEIIKKQNLSGQIDAIEFNKELLSSMYTQGAAYTNLILLGGYAGIFAIWRLTRQYLTSGTDIIVATLLLVSLTIFIAFEVNKMIASTILIRKLSETVTNTNKVPPEHAIHVWKKVNDEYAIKQSKWWGIALWPTVITGFLAGFILLFNFVFYLI